MIPHVRLRSAMRKIWMWSDMRRDALRAAKIAPGRYRCAECQAVLKMGELEIDHIVSCGPTPGSKNATPGTTWDGWITRLFCSPDGLRVLCYTCHDLRKPPKAVKVKKVKASRQQVGA